MLSVTYVHRTIKLFSFFIPVHIRKMPLQGINIQIIRIIKLKNRLGIVFLISLYCMLFIIHTNDFASSAYVHDVPGILCKQQDKDIKLYVNIKQLVIWSIKTFTLKINNYSNE